MAADDPVVLDQAGAVWRLRLNRAESRNALSPEIVEAALSALDAVERGRPAGLIVEGAGPVFCAGLNLGDLEAKSDGDMLHLLVRIEILLQRLWSLPCRTLGLAQKAAIGAGADILVCCHTRVLTPGARVAFPGLGFGIFLGTNRLGLRIGAGAAERVLAAGKPVTAERAEALGLADACVAEADWAAYAEAWAADVEALDSHVAAHLGTTAVRADGARDMEALVRSASRPGLKDRIAAYVAAQAKLRAAR